LAPDNFFGTQVTQQRYTRQGSNKPLKYFLMTIEHYLRWYNRGASGNPKVDDATRVLDFANTTIEHIYPSNAAPAIRDPSLDPLVDTLGNLTILGAEDNDKVANKAFPAKRPLYAASSLKMNVEISDVATWDEVAIESRQDRLKQIALKVFTL